MMNSVTSLQLQHLHTLDINLNKVHAIAISNNNKYIVTGGGNDRYKTPIYLQVWEIDTGKSVYSLAGHTADINYVAISPDDEKIVSVSADSTIRVLNLETGTEIYNIPNNSRQSNHYYVVAINPDGKTFITATSSRKNPIIWDLFTGKELATLAASNQNYYYYALTISPNGNIVAGGGGSSYIQIWDLQTKQELYKIIGHSSVGRSLCISPDNKTLVSGGDQRIKVWDLETGEARLSFYGHADLVRGIVITPDGNNLISAGDRFIKIWDLNTGKKLNSIEAHDDAIRALALSSDGTILASGGVGGKVKIWRVIGE